MLKSEVISYFGNRNNNVARALKVHKSTVSNWGDLIPEGQAAKLHILTKGALQYRPELYTDNQIGDKAA